MITKRQRVYITRRTWPSYPQTLTTTPEEIYFRNVGTTINSGEQVDLRAGLRSDAPDVQVADALDRAMAIKPERHDFRIGVGEKPTQPRHMSVTGG